MAPLPAKGFECPPTHVRHLCERLRNVDVIMSVGWQAQEPHFLGLLRSMRAVPPDVFALTGRGKPTAGPIASRVGAACGPLRRTEGDGGPTWAGLSSLGFTALVKETPDLATTIGEFVDGARFRRDSVAKEMDDFPPWSIPKPEVSALANSL